MTTYATQDNRPPAMPPHPLTRRQFEEDIKQTLRRNHPDIEPATIAEQAKLSTHDQWWGTVERYVRSGGTLSAKFLNTLHDPYLFCIISIDAANAGNNNPYPRGYVFPHCRA